VRCLLAPFISGFACSFSYSSTTSALHFLSVSCSWRSYLELPSQLPSAKRWNGTTTSYATTDINPTGSEVVGESYSPRMNETESQHRYIYELDAALDLRPRPSAIHPPIGTALNNSLPSLCALCDSVANPSWVWVLIYRAHGSGPPYSALHRLNPVLS
jgi:hypothetical protein